MDSRDATCGVGKQGWTKEKPIDSGYYWIRGKSNSLKGSLHTWHEIVEITGPSHGTEIRYVLHRGTNEDQLLDNVQFNSVEDVEWHGPILPPSD